MEFSIETSELQRVVRLLGVVAKVNISDFTGQVLIEANKDHTILFTSNNGSTAVTVPSDKTKVNSPGSVTILYGKLKGFVNSFSPWDDTFGTKEFSFISDGNNLNIHVDTVHENGKKSKGKLKLRCFSDMRLQKPKPFGEASFILNSNALKKAISKIIYAIDPNEARAFIQGINISFEDDEIYFVGTNGLTLSEYRVKHTNNLSGQNYVVKYDFMMGLRRAIAEETQIFFDIDGMSVKAKFDDIVFSGRLVVGHEYPSYRPVLEKFSNTFVVGKEALMSVLCPFMDLLDNEDNNRISFELKNRKIALYNDSARFDCDFDVDYDGDFVIDLNGKFLYSTVDAIQDDKILIKFSDEQGVLIFDSGNFEDQKALITPVRRR